MPSKYHFVSGLPRSGSTLLGALLRQNPRFHASMTSPVGYLANALLQEMSSTETAMLLDSAQQPQILRGLFDSFYASQSHCEVVFDTNRLWCSKLSLLRNLYPDAKVIVCVRDLMWVLDSLERLIRNQPYRYSKLFNSITESATVYSRVEALTQTHGLVGFSWAALKEAFYSDQADSLLIVEYEYLAREPEKVLRLIYQFIGEPWNAHANFENIDFDAPEFDKVLGLDGMHRVRSKVSFQARQSVLPPDIAAKFKNSSFWRDGTGSRAHVIASKPAQI
ncbi:MAG: sulfotransferase [Rhodoferax sp.]|nr:sulfotransferase [Rhodoferax sp.]